MSDNTVNNESIVTRSPSKKIVNDIILVGIVLLLAAGLFLIFFLGGDEGSYAVVTLDGEQIMKYPLTSDIEERISCKSEGDYNVLVIKDGVAYIKEANCPDGICAEHRPISKVGETVICLPHKLVISIEGEDSSSSPDI